MQQISTVAIRLRRAMELHQQGQLAQAEAMYRETIASDGGQFDALRLLGVSLYQQGRPMEAHGFIRKALLQNRNDAPTHVSLGLVLATLQRHEEAIICYDTALAIRPDNVNALQGRGASLRRLDRLEEAAASYAKATLLNDKASRTGIPYELFMAILGKTLQPRGFFEIGTSRGDSLRSIKCNAVCVDPNFAIEQNVLENRETLFFFQMTSDDFFARYNLNSLLPQGVDIAFLDGMHLYEFLLRDFINTERHCHSKSLLLLHDCLPINERMAERSFRTDSTEDRATKGFWTGDVWRLLPILKKYRPDLRIHLIDCYPTGLIACSRVDPNSRVLAENFDAIVKEFSESSLSSFGLERLWDLFPIIHSGELSQDSKRIRALFELH
jgi:hypothetical protein